MRANGTWAYGTSTSSLEASSLSGTYGAAGDVVTIRETGASLTGCLASEVGTYRASFSPACDVAVLRLVSDPCSLRAALMGGRTFTRL